MCRVLEVFGLSVVSVMLLVATEGAADEAISGTVEKVTLYRGQALVTRVVPIDAPQGGVEVVVSNLPEQVLGESLFAEGDEGLEIRAVRFRARAVGQEPRDDLRKLDEQIEQRVAEQEKTQKMKELAGQRMQYLDKLEGFVAPTASVELSKGVLNAESLERLTKFSFEQREQAAADLLALAQQEKETAKALALLQRKRSELAAGFSKTVREAVLFLNKADAGRKSLRLNYLVANCGWSPAYNFRAQPAGDEVTAEYNAIVQQMSGEDWSDIELTLSTASPALSAKGPGLAPFQVVLVPAVPGKPTAEPSHRDVAQQLSSIQQRYSKAHKEQLQAFNLQDNLSSSWEINATANDYQVLELTGGNEAILSVQQRVMSADDGPSLSYSLAGKVSMASRSDQQIVRIMQATLDSKLYQVAAPILTNYVYREAELKNTSDQDLLAGPVHVYLDGHFVGRGEIGTVARGQTFVLGFGADPQLRTRRELVKKDESVQGGNRELKFTYRLVVENFKKRVVPVRIVDRLPYAERDAEIHVALADMKDKLSDDAFYLRRERPKGILRWEVEVPAEASGEDGRIVEYSYTVEFDRNLAIADPAKARLGGKDDTGQPAADMLRQQFEALEGQREYQH